MDTVAGFAAATVWWGWDFGLALGVEVTSAKGVCPSRKFWYSASIRAWKEG
jgi:hypothetical protein